MPQDEQAEVGTVINSDGSLHNIEGRQLIKIQRLKFVCGKCLLQGKSECNCAGLKTRRD